MNQNASVTEFNPADFRKVGAEAQFDPQYLSSKDALRGVTVRVTKVNPKSLIVETPEGLAVKTDAWMLVPADKPFVKADAAPVLGSIVTLDHNPRYRRYAGLYVVCAVGTGGYRLARLGGDENRYLRNIPASDLRVVDPKDVLR